MGTTVRSRYEARPRAKFARRDGTKAVSGDIARDVSARREAPPRTDDIQQARLRLLEFAGSHPTDEFLTATLDELERLTGSSVGFYHFLESDQHTLILQNWSTNTLTRMCTAEGKGSHYGVDRAGVWADAVRLRRPVVHNDYAALPDRRGMPPGHAPVVRELVVPVFRGSLIRAIIGVGNKATDYTAQDIETVSLLADLSWDISERKLAEAALNERHSILHGVLQTIPALIFSVDRTYRYTAFNDSHAAVMRTLYGVEIERGACLLDCMTVAADREAARQHIDRALCGEQLVEEAYSGEGSDRRFFRVSHGPIRAEGGEVIGVAVLAQDMTDRRRAEERVAELNRELETRVLERTAELAAANDELEAFVYSVSHDLRAPLRHVDGFVRLLEQRIGAGLDERSRHYMETISHSARQMGQLIDDLLCFSRTARAEMSRKPVDLYALVADVIAEFEPETSGRSVSWQVGGLPTVSGDRALLRIAFVNLLSNALKFTRPRPHALIEVGSTVDARGKETAVFVRDNGVGFDPAYGAKLFGVFQRLHRAEEFEGSGIGLATVRRIISRHHGRTWAEGEVGRGAAFYFSLPARVGEE